MSEQLTRDVVGMRLNQTVGRLLRIGVWVSGLVVAAGAVLYLWHQGGTIADYRTFHPEPHTLSNLGEFGAGLTALHGESIILLGLLLLIATPVLYVVVALNGFRRQRDWLYVGVSLVVLAVLLFSLFFVR